MKKFDLKNGETCYFLTSKTRFQNSIITPFCRIFFMRTWMDSAQKSLVSDRQHCETISRGHYYMGHYCNNGHYSCISFSKK